MKKVVVACASGVATSMAIAGRARRLLKERGVEADVQAMGLGIVHKHYHEFDAYLCILPNPDPNIPIPVFKGISFLTGVGLNEELDKLVKLLKEEK